MKLLPPIVAILTYLLAGAAFTEAAPPWEAPDEPAHLAYAETLASGRLPSFTETYEYHQPPLYYTWPAFAQRATGAAPLPRGPINPRYPFATASYLHPPGDPAVAPLRLLRSFVGLLGALVVALAWATARAAFTAAGGPPRAPGPSSLAPSWEAREHHPSGVRFTGPIDPAFLAALCAALLPQFVFITHTISNDTLAAVCGALITYGLVRWVTPGTAADRRSSLRPLLCMGAGLALGLLAKLNVLPLALAVPVALLLRARADLGSGIAPRRAVRRILLAAMLIAAPVAAVALVTIRLLPGVTASLINSAVTRGLAVRPELSDPRFVAEQTVLMIASLWARFGWLSVLMPWWSYLLFGLALLAGAVGLPLAWRRGPETRRTLLVLGLCACAVLAAAVRSLLADPQPQGRLLFPGLAAIAVLATVGWSALLPGRAWRLWSVTVLGGLVATNLWVTGVLLPNAYQEAKIAPPRVDTRLDVPLPPATLRLDAPATARQSFRVGQAGFRRIEIAVADAAARGDARITARVVDDHGSTLGTTSVALGELGPKAWIGVDLSPQSDSAGRSYALEIDVSGGPGDGDDGGDGGGTLWLWRMPDGDGYPGGELEVGGAAATDLVFVTLLAGEG